MLKPRKTLTEKQRIQQISQLIKQDLANLKKKRAVEPNTVEVACEPEEFNY